MAGKSSSDSLALPSILHSSSLSISGMGGQAAAVKWEEEVVAGMVAHPDITSMGVVATRAGVEEAKVGVTGSWCKGWVGGGVFPVELAGDGVW